MTDSNLKPSTDAVRTPLALTLLSEDAGASPPHAAQRKHATVRQFPSHRFLLSPPSPPTIMLANDFSFLNKINVKIIGSCACK